MDGIAGIVLAGGRSERMGEPKPRLRWHGGPMVVHVLGTLAEALQGPLVVVRAPGQELPPLPDGVLVAEDALPGRGPLEGLAAGLRALAGEADAAFVSAADVPFLAPAFVRAVVAALAPGVDAAVPRVAGQAHPLSAAYRTEVLGAVERRLARDALRLRSLLDDLRVRWLDEQALLADLPLRDADPRLDSLRNVNTPEEYEAALAYARAIRSGPA